MIKKAALAAFGFIVAASFVGPQSASAQVHVGVGVNIGAPVVVQPAPVVVRPAPVVVEAPPTVVVYDDPFFVAHCWDFGFHDGWYYDHGTRYWVDRHHRRHYDYRYRDERLVWERHRHDNGWHGERGPGHDNGRHNGEWRGRGHDNEWRGGRGHDERADRGRGHGHGHDD